MEGHELDVLLLQVLLIVGVEGDAVDALGVTLVVVGWMVMWMVVCMAEANMP